MRSMLPSSLSLANLLATLEALIPSMQHTKGLALAHFVASRGNKHKILVTV